MSARSVNVVTQIAEAFNRRDLEALLALLHPEVEHRDRRDPGAAPLCGHDELRLHFQELWREHPDAHLELEPVAHDREWVVARQLWSGLGDEKVTTWVARRLREDRVIRIEVFATKEEALAAARSG